MAGGVVSSAEPMRRVATQWKIQEMGFGSRKERNRERFRKEDARKIRERERERCRLMVCGLLGFVWGTDAASKRGYSWRGGSGVAVGPA